jgi:hypothetical protein
MAEAGTRLQNERRVRRLPKEARCEYMSYFFSQAF